MALLLKQSTAVTLLIGPFLDDADGNTVEGGLTIAQADVRLSMNGGNMAQKTDVAACVHDELGYYTCDLDGTDTGTLGILKVMVHESGALPVWHEYQVVPSNVYDSLILGSDFLDTEVATMAANVVTAAAIATNAIDDDAIAADVYAQINAEVVDVFDTDVLAEPAQGAPPATPTKDQVLAYLFYALRNKANSTEDIKRFYANDGATVLWSKATSDDDTTYEEEEGISG